MGDSNVYTAERILSKRTTNGETQYHIKWKGYSSKSNTWEPAENILDRGLIDAFERTLTRRSRRSSAASSRSNRSSAATLPSSPTRSDRIQSPSNASVRSRSPVVNHRISTAVSTSPIASRASPAQQATPPPPPTPSLANSTASSPHKTQNDVKIPVKSSPVRATSTPILATPKEDNKVSMSVGTGVTTPMSSPIVPVNVNDNGSGKNHSIVNNNNSIITNNNVSKSKCFAIMNTVITDVTVNDQTFTITESKTNHGFFKEISRHSVAVDTTP